MCHQMSLQLSICGAAAGLKYLRQIQKGQVLRYA